jgi:hypothetical protein
MGLSLSLSPEAFFTLFPEPAFTVGDSLWSIILAGCFYDSCVEIVDPTGGDIERPASIVRILNPILLAGSLDFGVSRFDDWATSPVVSPITAHLTLILQTHIYSPYICILP